MKPLKIYVAGKYSANTEQERLDNTNKAIDMGVKLAQKGHIPFIPHLTHYFDMRAVEQGVSFDWDWYMDYDNVWLHDCDALFCLSISKGVDIELSVARDMNIPIYYSLDEIGKVNE